MATIDLEIYGHVTPQGEVRVIGSSAGGDPLFNEPLDIGAMIDALSERHEHSSDHRLSTEGRLELGALAETLADASEDVRTRLSQDALLKEQSGTSPHRKTPAGAELSLGLRAMIDNAG